MSKYDKIAIFAQPPLRCIGLNVLFQYFFWQIVITGKFISYIFIPVQSPPYMVKQPPKDEVLFQVKSRVDENDKPFVIECEAEGEPAPK